MSRLRSNFNNGTLSAAATNVATTLSSAGFAALPVVAAPDVLFIVLDPQATAGNPEIVQVTAHTASATTVTVVRGQEGTIARAHASGVAWVHAPTGTDFLKTPGVIDAQEYGLIADGTTDDGPQLRALIAAYPGYRILLPGAGRKTTIKSADGAGNGLTITASGIAGVSAGASAASGTILEGAGDGLSVLSIEVTGLKWGVVVGSQCKVRNMTLQVVGSITAPYWVAGVTCAAGANSEFVQFENVIGTIAAAVTVPTIPGATATGPPAFFAAGPDKPGVTNMDIAQTEFKRCWVFGKAGMTGFLFGNNTGGGNVTASKLDESGATSCDSVVTLAGSGLIWTHGGSSGCLVADLVVLKPPGEGITLVGVRGELGKKAFDVNYTTGGDTVVTMTGCAFLNMSPAGGVIGRFRTQGTVSMTACRFSTSTNNASFDFASNGALGTVPILMSLGCTYDNLTPFQALDLGFVRRVIIGTNYDNQAGIVARNPNYDYVVDQPVNTYTPTYADSNGLAVLGNGTITGTYTKVGTLYTVHVKLTAGTTTTFGTGSLRLGLPATVVTNATQIGSGYIFHAATATFYLIVPIALATVNFAQLASHAIVGQVTGAAPVALAATDTIQFSITYNA